MIICRECKRSVPKLIRGMCPSCYHKEYYSMVRSSKRIRHPHKREKAVVRVKPELIPPEQMERLRLAKSIFIPKNIQQMSPEKIVRYFNQIILI